MSALMFGDRVRMQCTATGRYLGTHDGKALALGVSAQDNDLFIDEVNLTTGDSPSATLPVPSDGQLIAAAAGVRYGRQMRSAEPVGRQEQ